MQLVVTCPSDVKAGWSISDFIRYADCPSFFNPSIIDPKVLEKILRKCFKKITIDTDCLGGCGITKVTLTTHQDNSMSMCEQELLDDYGETVCYGDGNESDFRGNLKNASVESFFLALPAFIDAHYESRD